MAVETGAGLNFITSSLTSPRLAYALKNGGGQSIWRMHIPERHRKGEPPERMFASTREEFAQQYSPDGKKVAFESKRGGNLKSGFAKATARVAPSSLQWGPPQLAYRRGLPTGSSLPSTPMCRATPRYS